MAEAGLILAIASLAIQGLELTQKFNHIKHRFQNASNTVASIAGDVQSTSKALEKLADCLSRSGSSGLANDLWKSSIEAHLTTCRLIFDDISSVVDINIENESHQTFAMRKVNRMKLALKHEIVMEWRAKLDSLKNDFIFKISVLSLAQQQIERKKHRDYLKQEAKLDKWEFEKQSIAVKIAHGRMQLAHQRLKPESYTANIGNISSDDSVAASVDIPISLHSNGISMNEQAESTQQKLNPEITKSFQDDDDDKVYEQVPQHSSIRRTADRTRQKLLATLENLEAASVSASVDRQSLDEMIHKLKGPAYKQSKSLDNLLTATDSVSLPGSHDPPPHMTDVCAESAASPQILRNIQDSRLGSDNDNQAHPMRTAIGEPDEGVESGNDSISTTDSFNLAKVSRASNTSQILPAPTIRSRSAQRIVRKVGPDGKRSSDLTATNAVKDSLHELQLNNNTLHGGTSSQATASSQQVIAVKIRSLNSHFRQRVTGPGVNHPSPEAHASQDGVGGYNPIRRLEADRYTRNEVFPRSSGVSNQSNIVVPEENFNGRTETSRHENAHDKPTEPQEQSMSPKKRKIVFGRFRFWEPSKSMKSGGKVANEPTAKVNASLVNSNHPVPLRETDIEDIDASDFRLLKTPATVWPILEGWVLQNKSKRQYLKITKADRLPWVQLDLLTEQLEKIVHTRTHGKLIWNEVRDLSDYQRTRISQLIRWRSEINREDQIGISRRWVLICTDPGNVEDSETDRLLVVIAGVDTAASGFKYRYIEDTAREFRPRQIPSEIHDPDVFGATRLFSPAGEPLDSHGQPIPHLPFFRDSPIGSEPNVPAPKVPRKRSYERSRNYTTTAGSSGQRRPSPSTNRGQTNTIITTADADQSRDRHEVVNHRPNHSSRRPVRPNNPSTSSDLDVSDLSDSDLDLVHTSGGPAVGDESLALVLAPHRRRRQITQLRTRYLLEDKAATQDDEMVSQMLQKWTNLDQEAERIRRRQRRDRRTRKVAQLKERGYVSPTNRD